MINFCSTSDYCVLYRNNWPFKFYVYYSIEDEMMEILNQEIATELEAKILGKMAAQVGFKI